MLRDSLRLDKICQIDEVCQNLVSILEIHYSPLGDPTHRFGKVKQCDPRETRTPNLAFPVQCNNQQCYRANGLAR